jgi:hypothetical protein
MEMDMTKKSLELAIRRQEAIRDQICEILILAGVVADEKTFTAICDLDAMVCMAVGLDPSKHAMADSIKATVNHSQTDCRDGQLPLHTS